MTGVHSIVVRVCGGDNRGCIGLMGTVIFAFKNNRDISLGFALGSATQISLFVVPLCVIISWIMGNKMDLNFNPLKLLRLLWPLLRLHGFTLKDGTSHYMGGFLLLLSYVVIGACLIVYREHH
ncbi:hypothetical protein K1719_034240 [Acacia pycnantha]|nr:hypothetical protein K1719_034240 [Acacia pycnantha]